MLEYVGGTMQLKLRKIGRSVGQILPSRTLRELAK